MALANQWQLRVIAAALALTSFYSTGVVAQEASASGEVRRVDAQAGKITIKHGAISELELPAMTLVYHVAPALLKGIEPGDKVKFTAKREAGKYIVTKLSK